MDFLSILIPLWEKKTPHNKTNKQTNFIKTQLTSADSVYEPAAVNILVTNPCIISLCSCPLHCLEFRLLGLSCLVLFHSHIIYPPAAEMQPSGVLTVHMYSVSSLKRIHAPDTTSQDFQVKLAWRKKKNTWVNHFLSQSSANRHELSKSALISVKFLLKYNQVTSKHVRVNHFKLPEVKHINFCFEFLSEC